MAALPLLLLLLTLTPTTHAATPVIRRQAVPSAFFNETGRNCDYAGEIRLAHPMSVGPTDRHYVLGSQMLEAAHMVIDQVNTWPRCGVSMQGSNYSLSLTTYGDESSKDKTYQIAQQLVHPTYDFLLAGYSSSLTAFLTPTAQNHSKVCVTAGSSRTSVHAGKDHIFGLLPPSGSFLANAFEGINAHGARSVAFLAEDGIGSCDGSIEMAELWGMQHLGGIYIEENAPYEVYLEVAHNMSALNPDVMFTCVRTTYNSWNSAMREIDWTPKAQIYTIVVGQPEFEEAIGPTDLPYLSGVTIWDPSLPPIPDLASGWTPREFAVHFEQAAFRPPAYQHTSMAASVSVLVQAMERVGTFSNWTQRVKQELTHGYFPTVYGNVSFDVNGQSRAPGLFLQYDTNQTLHLLYPQELISTDFEMVYPLPSYAHRDCMWESKCSKTGGDCTPEGYCDCPSDLSSTGVGPTAECFLPPEELVAESVPVWVIVVAVVVSLLVTPILAVIALYHLNKYKQKQIDSTWQVDPRDIVFPDPAHVIGRGSFGLVLLAEYRGTKVAIKRALPPNKIANKKKKKKRKDKQSDVPSMGSSSVAFDPSEKDHPKEEQNMGKRSQVMHSKIPYANLSESEIRKKMKQEFIAEMRQLSQLRHPNVVNVMGAVIKNTMEPMMIMEYMDHGSLYDILHNNTMFLEGDIILTVLHDITQGCRFLHAANPKIIHGDLKAANILVDSRMRAKVADFGLSQKKEMGAVGTPFWMAPELLRGESTNTPASDVYSFGMILYEVYSRKDPYEGEDPELVLLDVADKECGLRPPVPKDCPPQLAGMMTDCLRGEPDDRPTFEELDKRLKRVDAAVAEPLSSDASTRKAVSLYDIFPKHIADAMSAGQKIEPEHKDCVTIYFSDIVGFTNISSELDPRKVADMLDRLYLKFDKLSEKYDIFKVETIGDAYMAVTNLVKNQAKDHATRIAEFSVEAVKAANETMVDEEDPSRGYVNIRVGFHSGPVVADVVGSRNPRYCLFGDTVNTASRMESYSYENRIHCSESSFRLLGDQKCRFPILSRGEIDVKGKGAMRTFWINEGKQKAGEKTETAPLEDQFTDEDSDDEDFL